MVCHLTEKIRYSSFQGRRTLTIPMMKTVLLETKKKNRKNSKKVKEKWAPAIKEIDGVPICEKYKYLGTVLTPKLTCTEQIAQIKRKCGNLFVKLMPYLINATSDARRYVADHDETMV